MSLRRTLRSVVRAARGEPRKSGLVKGAAKAAAKWAAKQGIKRGAQALAAAVAANPVAWAVGAAVAVVAAAALAVVVVVSSISPIGDMPETAGLSPGDNLAAPGSGLAEAGVPARGLNPNSREAAHICGNVCSPILTGGGGIAANENVIEFWRKGAGGMPALRGAKLFCPMDPGVIKKGKIAAGWTREAWGNERGGGRRFHAGLDIYKEGEIAEAEVRAIFDGTTSRAGSRHAFWLTSEIDGQPVHFFYEHIDNGHGKPDTRPRNGVDWKGGETFNNYRLPSGEEAAAGLRAVTTISTSKSGGMDKTAPHIHLGVSHTRSTPRVGAQGVGHWNPYPAMKAPCSLEPTRT